MFSRAKPEPQPTIARFQSRPLPAGVEFAIVKAGTSATNVSFRLVDEKGEPIEAAVICDVWLTGNAEGSGVAPAYAERNHLNTDGRSIKTLEVTSGALFGVTDENAILRMQTTAGGYGNIWFTKASGSVYLAVQLPGWPFPCVSRRLTDEDFGEPGSKMKEIGRLEREAVAARKQMERRTSTTTPAEDILQNLVQ